MDISFFRKNIVVSLAILVFSLLVSSYVVFAQNEDLVSRWNGNSVSGRTASDIVSGNDGTIFGGVTVVPGQIGNAFKLNGSNGRIKAGNSENLNFGTGPFSLETWFIWDGRAGVNNVIRKSNYPVSGPGAGYWIRIGGGNLEFYTGETTGIEGASRGVVTAPVSRNTLHYVVATRDRSGAMKLYVDGEPKGTAKASGADTTSEAPFLIGAWDDRFGVTEAFSGLVGEVSVYSEALDSSTVESLYNVIAEDLELYRTIEPYIKKGETPGQCTTVSECRAYCDLEDNIDECYDFAVKAGLIEIEDPYLIALRDGSAPGGCIGEDACADYCGEASHIRECVDFFAKFDVLPPDVLQALYDLIAACEQEPDFEACIESGPGGTEEPPVDPGTVIQVGVNTSQTIQGAIERGESPGKCKDEASCRAYCENLDHIDECLDFVEKFDLATPDELKEMRQMAAAKAAGVPFPGNCKTKQGCLQYCEAPSHAVECVDFAVAAGFISGDEAVQAKKFAPLIARGETPGGCTTKDQCEAYCEEGVHLDECMDFAIEHKLFPPDELETMRKIRPFVKAGTMPGGCKSKDECEAYCTNGDHFEECLEIGLAIGVIKADEVDIIRKSGGKGPGSCRSREACDAFCSDPNNQKECMDFAVRIGLMTQEEAEQAQAAGDVKQCFEEMDDKIAACFITHLGVDMFEQMKAGKMPHDIAIIEKMRKAKACVQQYSDQATDVLGDFLKALPAADACIADEFGPDFIGRLRRMAIPCSQMKGIRGKMEACFLQGTNALFEPCAQKECNQVQSCMMDVSKPLMSLAKQVEAGDPTKAQKREFPKSMQDKFKACGIDPDFDPTTCISKSTCTEFFSCLNPRGDQQSQGDQPGEGEMPPELKERMDSCQKELVEIKMRECTDKPTCSEVNACLKAQQQPSKGDAKDTGKKLELPPDVESRLMACQKEEVQAKIDACFDKSCSEFDACLKSLTEGAGGGDQKQQQQGEPDPKMKAKIQACIDEKINACIAKPCSEFNACLSALQQGGGGGGEQKKGQSNPAIEAKFKSCQPKDGGGAPPRQPQTPEGYKAPEYPQASQYPQAPGGSSTEIPVTPELCANFTSVPSCSYVGAPDSQNYQLCAKCYPEKAQHLPYKSPDQTQTLFGAIRNFIFRR